MNELGLVCFLDHMLMQNMCHMANMELAQKVFMRYKKFYKDNHSWDNDRIVTENNDMKMQMCYLQQGMENKNKNIKNKNKKLNELKAHMDDPNK